MSSYCSCCWLWAHQGQLRSLKMLLNLLDVLETQFLVENTQRTFEPNISLHWGIQKEHQEVSKAGLEGAWSNLG